MMGHDAICDTRYLRPIKGERLRQIHDKFENRTGLLRIKEYHNLLLTPEGQIPGASYSGRSDLFVDDCDYCTHFHTPEDNAVAADVMRTEGTVVFGGYLRTQWGHFLVNTTSRLWPLFRSPSGISGYDKILFIADDAVTDRLKGNYLRFMTLAGLADRIVIATGPVYIPWRVIVPDISLEHPDWFACEFAGVHRMVVGKGMESPSGIRHFPKKIFLTRSGLEGADENELDISLLDEFFAMNGYEILSPERLELVDFIHYMQNAEEIAMISGTLAHNILFANPKSNIHILERTAYNNIYQAALSLITGIHPVCIDAFWLPENAPGVGQLFLYGFTEELKRFARDHKMVIPQNTDVNHDTLLKFVNRFHSLYGGRVPGIRQLPPHEPVAEAYQSTKEHIKCPLPEKPAFRYRLISLARKLHRYTQRFSGRE